MKYKSVWLSIAFGGLLFHATMLALGYSTTRHAVEDFASSIYWSGVALLWHWYEARRV